MMSSDNLLTIKNTSVRSVYRFVCLYTLYLKKEGKGKKKETMEGEISNVLEVPVV